MPGPLAGIRVLDLSRLLPGPFCSQLLVDLGAEVIKVEDHLGGDYLRYTPPLLDDGNSVLFHALNRGKKSVSIDLKSKEGKAQFLRLLPTADVVLESFRPGVLHKLALAPATMLEEHPRLIVCSISGYGQTGPDRLKAGHDINYAARAGALGMMKEPTLLPVQVADLAGGAWPAAFQIAAALVGRERTGQGCLIDVSMTDGVFGLMAMTLSRALVEDAPLGGGADLLVGKVPCYGVYPTKDGFMSVGSLEPKFWASLCGALDRPDLLDRAFDDGASGLEVQAILAQHFSTKTTGEWTEALAAVDACVEPVNTPEQALHSDPQLLARGLKVPVDIAGKTFDFPTLGLHTSGAAPANVRGPRLGEHNDELLKP